MACRLAEKAYLQQRQIYVHGEDAASVNAIDELLWAFKPDSFVPHSVVDGQSEPSSQPPSQLASELQNALASVTLGWAEPTFGKDDVLISLCTQTPLYFSRFAQMVEIVAKDDADKAAGRERYSYYKARGYPITTHNLTS